MDVLQKMEQAGFNVELIEGRLSVTPASKLSPDQDEWIRGHKDELIQAVRLRDKALGSSSAGNDIAPSNDERCLIHIPSFTLQTGQKVSFDASIPKANLERLRQVVKFKLIDNEGGGALLGAPGTGRDELASMLIQKYGDKLESIDDIRHGSIEREVAPYPEGNPAMMRALKRIHGKQADGQLPTSTERLFLQAVELCRQEDLQHGAIEREVAPYYERDPKAKSILNEILAKQASGAPLDDGDRLFMSAVELCKQEHMRRRGGQVIEGESVEVNLC